MIVVRREDRCDCCVELCGGRDCEHFHFTFLCEKTSTCVRWRKSGYLGCFSQDGTAGRRGRGGEEGGEEGVVFFDRRGRGRGVF